MFFFSFYNSLDSFTSELNVAKAWSVLFWLYMSRMRGVSKLNLSALRAELCVSYLFMPCWSSDRSSSFLTK